MPESTENADNDVTETTEDTLEVSEGNTDEESSDSSTTQGEETEPDADADTFPRSYVEKLRKESAEYRTRAQKADALATELWSARVAASGRLADPSDLPMPEGADPTDTEAITEAINSLLESKPHMAARVPRGDIGQGTRDTVQPFSLLGALNTHAR